MINFLNEWKCNYNCQKKSFSKFVRFFGITQDPNSLNYIVVMSYVKEGSLRKCLSNIVKLNWHDKLQLLKKIILGLKIIHKSDLVHCDLHDGNILISDNEVYIIDLGLCKPIGKLQNPEKICGVIPYMAPEVLRGKPYTSASDIYSFSMIMWEFTSGAPPFNDRAHDHHLSLSVCKGERPEIITNTPKYYIDMMRECWDSEPTKRPTLKFLEKTISEWLSCFDKCKIVKGSIITIDTIDTIGAEHITSINNSQALNIMKEFEKVSVQSQANSSIMQSHSQSYYTSRFLRKVNEDEKAIFNSDSNYIVEDKSECYDCEIMTAHK